jgi:hypothetical protein
MEKTKDLILILNYSPDNKRQELLRNLVNNINNINNDGFDIMIATHSFVPQDISDKVDYVIYEKENLLLTDINSKYTMEFVNDDFSVKTTECKKYNHGFAVFRLVLLGLRSAKNLDYVKVHLFEYDSEIKTDIEIKDNSNLLDVHPIIWYKWSHFPYPTSPISYNLLKISDSWFNITKEKLMSFFNGNMSNTCEQYHMMLINESDNVLIKDMKLFENIGVKMSLNSDIIDYQWVVPVYDDNSKKMVLFSWGKDEIKNMEIKLIVNDSIILNYTVKPGCWILRDIGDIDSIQSIMILVNDTMRNFIDFTKIDKNIYINKNTIN